MNGNPPNGTPAGNENDKNGKTRLEALREELLKKHPDWTPEERKAEELREVERLVSAGGRA